MSDNICKGVTKDGGQCFQYKAKGSNYCRFHDPKAVKKKKADYDRAKAWEEVGLDLLSSLQSVLSSAEDDYHDCDPVLIRARDAIAKAEKIGGGNG